MKQMAARRALMLLCVWAFAAPVMAADDGAKDPVLALANAGTSQQLFRDAVSSAVARHPAITEARASQAEARASRQEARAGLLPTVDVDGSTYRVLSRKFSDDPDNIIERSRAHSRTDLTVSVQEKLLDFGATSQRISAAGARLRAAAASVDVSSDQVALRMIAAWYDVFTYRALVRLADDHAVAQRSLRGDIQNRIDQGYSAKGDLLRIDSALAETNARKANFQRQLANAESRFTELAGQAPPPALTRAPPPAQRFASADMARVAADRAPAVRAAEANAEGAKRDARASRADNLPTVSVGVIGGRYGVFEDREDYDVRASVTLHQRFSGALYAKASEVNARAAQAAARADRTREEAERDAVIAWSDINALDAQVTALEANYTTGRDARDQLIERFRLTRGTLFDVLAADNAVFSTAASYIEALGDRDAARYALLSKTGRLLGALDIPEAAPTTEAPR